eukprot:12452811-Ditylum_brightwellii.AAC.1
MAKESNAAPSSPVLARARGAADAATATEEDAEAAIATEDEVEAKDEAADAACNASDPGPVPGAKKGYWIGLAN